MKTHGLAICMMKHRIWERGASEPANIKIASHSTNLLWSGIRGYPILISDSFHYFAWTSNKFFEVTAWQSIHSVCWFFPHHCGLTFFEFKKERPSPARQEIVSKILENGCGWKRVFRIFFCLKNNIIK